MIVEAPKYGASRRAAEISAPRLAEPTTNAISLMYATGAAGGRWRSPPGTSRGSSVTVTRWDQCAVRLLIGSRQAEAAADFSQSVRPELPRLLLREDDDLAGLFRESFEHGAPASVLLQQRLAPVDEIPPC